MKTITFESLGTKWSIILDHETLDLKTKELIISSSRKFEQKFSRFIPDSLVNKYNGNQEVKDPEFNQLLSFGKKLEKISKNTFNINVGQQLGDLGYGSGDQGIDFGGYGKGWLIDKISILLKDNDYHFFLIDAGGDIYATTKSNEDAWIVALEHPKNKEIAIGTVELNNSALAASSPFKRTWNNNHHLIDTETGKPTKNNRAVFVQARDAKTADGVATTLSVCDKNNWNKISDEFKCEYLVLDKNGISKSNNLSANIF